MRLKLEKEEEGAEEEFRLLLGITAFNTLILIITLLVVFVK